MDETIADGTSTRGGAVVDVGRSGSGAPLAAGTLVGRYLVVERMGAGAMGQVYAAYDPELDRRVALKLLHATRLEAQARLKREARALAKLEHPNVVSVFDVGDFEGRSYVAMAFVKGEVLGEWRAGQGDQRGRAFLRVYLEAGDGLAAAHAAGLVHRDFKPDNVMVDGQRRARVLDFGLAQELRRRESPAQGPAETASAARELALTGTPAYMSPEQFMGAELDARSDQFSYCVVLWEAMTGVRPFAGETLPALALSVTRGEIHKDARASQLPKHIEQALRRGLSLEATDRWPDMDSLLVALRFDPRRRRRRIAAGLLSLTPLAALGVVMATGDAAVPRNVPVACARAGEEVAESWNGSRLEQVRTRILATGLPFAEAAAQEVERELAAYSQAWAAARKTSCEDTMVHHRRSERAMDLRMRCLDERRASFDAVAQILVDADAEVAKHAVELVASLPTLDPCNDEAYLDARVRPPDDPAAAKQVRELRAQGAQAKALMVAAKLDEGISVVDGALVDAEALAYQPLIAELQVRKGSLLERAGKYKLAVEVLEPAYFLAKGQQHNEAVREAGAELVFTYGVQLENAAQAQAWAKHARADLGTAPRPSEEARTLNAIAQTLEKAGRWSEALVEHQHALRLREVALGPTHPGVAGVWNNIGIDLDNLGRHQEALEAYQHAYELKVAHYGAQHPAVATSLTNMGVTLRKLRRFDEALSKYEAALRVDIAVLGEGHVDVAKSRNNIGDVLLAQGNHEGALRAYDAALEIFEATLGPEHPHVGFPLNNIGSVRLQLGEYEAARVVFVRAQEIWEPAMGASHVLMGYGLSGEGEALIGLGRARKAREVLERALEIRESAGDKDTIAETRLLLARALGHDSTRAQKLAVAALTHYESQPTTSEQADKARLWLAG